MRDIEFLIKNTRELGVPLHRIGGVSDQGRATENNISSNFSFSKINDLIEYFRQKYETEKFKIGGFEDIDCNKEMNCGAGFRVIKLSPLFMVSPCPMLQLNIGDLNKEKMAEIFQRNSRVFAKLRRPFNDTCKECILIEDCKNCIAEGFNNKNKVDKCEWFSNEYLKIKENYYESQNHAYIF